MTAQGNPQEPTLRAGRMPQERTLCANALGSRP
jgi:hypothetical protein